MLDEEDLRMRLDHRPTMGVIFVLCVLMTGIARAQGRAEVEFSRQPPPHLLIIPGAVDLVIPGEQNGNPMNFVRVVFPEAASDFSRRFVIEKFGSGDGIPLPITDASGTQYARYSFRRGYLDFGLMRKGVLVKPFELGNGAEETPLVVIYHRAFRLTIEPPDGFSAHELHFQGKPEEYRYILLRVGQPIRVAALPEPAVVRQVFFWFFELLGAVVVWSLVTGLLARGRRISEEVSRVGNLLVLLSLVYALFLALDSENVLAIAYYHAGRLAILAIFAALGLVFVAGRLVHYPGVRGKMPIPFTEYTAQVLRQTFLVTAPILVYLSVDSLVDTFWISLLVFGVFFVIVTISSPFMVKWLFRARALNPTDRLAIEEYCRRHGVRIHHFYEYTPRYTFSPNAFVAGVFPFNRALFISTHLLEFLTPDERNSVMSHELAHARFQHPFWLFAFTLGYLGAAGGVISLLPDRYANVWIGLLVGAGALLFFAVSRAFERQADRVAAAEYGEVYLSAMRKLYSTAPDSPSARFEVLLTHPSQQRRFEAIKKWISSAA